MKQTSKKQCWYGLAVITGFLFVHANQAVASIEQLEARSFYTVDPTFYIGLQTAGLLSPASYSQDSLAIESTGNNRPATTNGCLLITCQHTPGNQQPN